MPLRSRLHPLAALAGINPSPPPPGSDPLLGSGHSVMVVEHLCLNVRIDRIYRRFLTRGIQTEP